MASHIVSGVVAECKHPWASELLDEDKFPADIYSFEVNYSEASAVHAQLSAESQLVFQLWRSMAHLCTMLLPDDRSCAVRFLQWLDALVRNWNTDEVPVK
jgi:hypothetical protein